ncbi:MAG: hypothetical protein A2042_05510 [Candidatus Schekmanbacteria bacterium GWA2_38_11]|uniref:Uncharacterized protein n=1 Tax=Candidatus Schekmanbacteria bacterium GWA2_38_11 TaxID=1817876 RepID=A0A1F7RFL9_9BACT|nr:MAG: hypothetical protein A2042_05510 [Candidatus Schekmanbacteria bacterium GWA2_38_11]
MAIKAEKLQKLILVCIYDPLPIQKVRIDQIRQEELFELISIIEEKGIFLADQAKNTEISIQLTRLEYTDSNNLAFDKRNLEIYENIVQLLPPLRVKAVGINLHYTLIRDEDKLAAEFIRDKFLNEKNILQDILGNKIIGNSTRIFYGEPDDHFDIRVFPVDLISREIGITLHKHKDIDIADQKLLIQTTKELLIKTCEENIKIMYKLF